MRDRIDSPTILLFCGACFIIQFLNTYTIDQLTLSYFVTDSRVSWGDPMFYWRSFGSAFGHSSWSHLSGNMTLLLFAGITLEQKVGSLSLAFMIAFTALSSGIMNAILFDTRMLGASGIVFMVIVLGSMSGYRGASKIPLSAMLILSIYLGNEVRRGFGNDSVSQFAHIWGGITGLVYGWILGKVKRFKESKSPLKIKARISYI